MSNDLGSETWREWNSKTRTDPDLAAHITIVWHRGICLYGLPKWVTFLIAIRILNKKLLRTLYIVC